MIMNNSYAEQYHKVKNLVAVLYAGESWYTGLTITLHMMDKYLMLTDGIEIQKNGPKLIITFHV